MSRPGSGRAAGVAAGLLAGLAYAAASIALTWPLALSLDTTLFGDHGDTRAWAWWLWAKAQGHVQGGMTPLLAAPFGLAIDAPFRQPIAEWLPLGLAYAWNEIVAINLFVLIAFPLTALATFALLRYLGVHASGALFGGVAFGFCPAAVMQATGGHVSFAFNLFLPLFLLALFHNRARRSIASALGVATAFAGIAFTALYFAYFAAYFALLFLLYDFCSDESTPSRTMWVNYAACAVLALALVVPVEWAAIAEQLTAPRDAVARAGRARDIGDLSAFASRPWNYLVPSIDHPVLGPYVEDFARARLHGSNLFEQTLYLGYAPLGLTLAGLLATLRGRLEARHASLVRFFTLAAAFGWFLSLPPLVAGVPTLSYAAYDFLPMFRAYVRSGILVSLFVACAAAVYLSHLAQRMRARPYGLLLGGLTLALLFEFWTVSPSQSRELVVPPVYAWLARQSGDLLVAEYPMLPHDEAAAYAYPFWQRVHGKRIVNGAPRDDAKAWALHEKVRDLSEPGAAESLVEAGVHYVVVHRDMYREGPIPGPIKRYYEPARASLQSDRGKAPVVPSRLQLVATFGPDLVFMPASTGTGHAEQRKVGPPGFEPGTKGL
jgi:hypothetical protein